MARSSNGHFALRALLLSGLLILRLQGSEDAGYVDEIRINDRAFDSLDRRDITFYAEDLQNGEIVVTGLLESEDDATPVSELGVEISVDGGATWTAAQGHGEWRWSFCPETGREYDFALRVTRRADTAAKMVQTGPLYVHFRGFRQRIVTTPSMAVSFRGFQPKIVTTDAMGVTFRGFEPKVVMTPALTVKFRGFAPRVVTTEPMAVAFHGFTQKVVTTDGLAVRFRTPVTKEATTAPLTFRFRPVASLQATTSPLRFRFSGITPLRVTTAPLTFRFRKVASKQARTEALKFRFRKVASKEARTEPLTFRFRTGGVLHLHSVIPVGKTLPALPQK